MTSGAASATRFHSGVMIAPQYGSGWTQHVDSWPSFETREGALLKDEVLDLMVRSAATPRVLNHEGPFDA